MSTPNSIRLSSQKAFAVFILSFYLVINLSSCTLLNVNLTPTVSALKEKEQFLAVDAAFPPKATIGGTLASNAPGHLRWQMAHMRDMVIYNFVFFERFY